MPQPPPKPAQLPADVRAFVGRGPELAALARLYRPEHMPSDTSAIHTHLGKYSEALAYLHESVRMFRELGETHGEAESLVELGTAHYAIGEPEKSAHQWRYALAIFEKLGSTETEPVRALLESLDAEVRARPGTPAVPAVD